MFKVYLCIATQHDWRLALLAVFVCATATGATMFLFSKVPAVPPWRRLVWLGLTGLVAGLGIWTTHFVAMLAFRTGLPTGYEPLGTLGSLLLAVLCMTAGFGLASMTRAGEHRSAFALAGGAVIGCGATLMHYVGMAAYRTAGHVSWSPGYVAASVMVGAGLSAAALLLAHRRSGVRNLMGAAALLMAAVVGMHFTGMSAVTVTPDLSVDVPRSLLSDGLMASLAVLVAALIIVTAVGAALFDAANRSTHLRRLRETVDAMPGSLALYDAQDRLQLWNNSFEQAHGGADNVRAGVTFEALIRALVARGGVASATGREEAWIAHCLDIRRRAATAEPVQVPDGRWIQVENKRTSAGGIVTVMHDISALKQAEAVMALARDEAETANRMKSEFLANMSHEIRTPMNGVIGMNALLLRSDLGPEQRKFAEAVRTSAESLLGLINDVLDVSKLEAGKVEIEDVDFSLETIVEDVVELMSPRAQEKLLEIACYVDPGARRALRGDPARIRQVLLNLMSNATKFTSQGYVSIEVRARSQGADRTRLRIEVQDTGIGLTADAKSRLFEKFQQADGSISRRFGGTGLGLSICRQLMQLMGGDIGVSDREGGGSIFWLDLDLANAGAAPRRNPCNKALRGARVLVIDDIELNRSIFRRQLEAEGAVVVEADGGDAGLAAMARAEADDAPFDLVLLDHMMPDLSGDIVAERIRARADWTQPKLVLASSMDVGRDDRAFKAGFDAFLTKPVRLKTLLDCLSAQLSQEASGPPAAALAPAAAPVAPVKLAPSAGSRAQVLLADDNDVNTLLAVSLLEGAGYAVDCVVNGVEAVEAARAKAYDLILMDVQMPQMDGLEAARLIADLPGGHGQAPIVAMTANAMVHDQQACFDAGMVDFVAKPYDPDEFLIVVEHYAGDGAPRARALEASPADEAPAFDAAHFAKLTSALAPAQIVRMLDAYLDRAEERVEVLRADVVAGDLIAAALSAHSVKGVAANFGAKRLSLRVAALEAMCKAGDADGARSLIDGILEASHDADAALRARRAESGQHLRAAS